MGSALKLNLTFIGGGKIAQAMIQGLMKQETKSKVMIRAVDPNENRVSELRAKGHIAEFEFNEKMARDTDVLILAVKPQQSAEVLRTLTNNPLKKSSLILSVVAGLPLQKIADAHPGTLSLIRAMPNTPATIGKGITVWIGSSETSASHFETTQLILRASEFLFLGRCHIILIYTQFCRTDKY